ncbi:UNVERIFIED_CONTAM: hypothetical protein Scaly_0695300, partial [Sesamum calycinum]
RRTAILLGVVDIGFFAAALSVTHLLLHGDMRINAIGFMCSGLNIIMYASPLAAM